MPIDLPDNDKDDLVGEEDEGWGFEEEDIVSPDIEPFVKPDKDNDV